MDRAKHLIISGGSNIYPAEVEAVLRLHPAVRDAAVVGVPGRLWGEVVVAVLVATGDRLIEVDEVAEHCLAVLSAYKRPRRFVVLDELPMNAYGKVVKSRLRELFAQAQD